ncbi:signal peptidase I [Myxacorys almedinensis]|uniref:Signal peptidase I n=1 Tax=Myxacorys almedinensis A TaxID=2690445 RepID=A0A8J7ZBJ4_9CYAN|nr:signal peptidase I [Myxacorys almedinensis]NDJ19918.1 signal peptidase I [Myxacorys almedinensis A]
MTPEPATKPSTSPSPNWKLWWENIQILVAALILALIVRAYVAEPRFIPSDSMIPTLRIGDRLVVEKLSYRFRNPELGEIIVFDPPPQLQDQGYSKDQAFIKRVIGRPGQTVEVKDGEVLVNNRSLEEPYIAQPPKYRMPPVQVPENSFFVMGDNRNNSNDSHVWGFLPKEYIVGRALFRFFPFNRIGGV